MTAADWPSFDEQYARAWGPDGIGEAVAGASAGDSGAGMTVAAVLARVAFDDQARLRPVYDTLAAAVTGQGNSSGDAMLPARAPPGGELAARFRTAVDEVATTRPAELTAHLAGLGEVYGAERAAACERALMTHPAVVLGTVSGLPARFATDSLTGLPVGSLGRVIAETLKAHGFTLEVLDPLAVLAKVPESLPASRYTAWRILQMHDVWHTMGGFRLTPGHEVAISAFQAAQFDHNYSACLLATAVAATARFSPGLLGPVLGEIAGGWRHGRATPELLAIPFEDHWAEPVTALRTRFGIHPYDPGADEDLYGLH